MCKGFCLRRWYFSYYCLCHMMDKWIIRWRSIYLIILVMLPIWTFNLLPISVPSGDIQSFTLALHVLFG